MSKHLETGTSETATLTALAEHFVSKGKVTSVAPLGNGNINSTYLVTVAAPTGTKAEQTANFAKRFVLQRINSQVFRQPELVIQNMAVLTEHLQGHLQDSAVNETYRWETPRILPTNTAQNFWRDDAGEYWRAISFIENSQVCETVKSVAHAKEVGYGLAMFHRLISTIAVDRLADTLEGFHITPSYLAQYEQVLQTWKARNNDNENHTDTPTTNKEANPKEVDLVQYCLDFVEQRKDWAHVLEQAKDSGKLHLRPIHGDPKVNNILLDAQGRAISLIDLDTLKPGLVHYDIGDCLRSGCNPLGEETEDWQRVEFDTNLAKAMLEGYLSLAKDFLIEQDYHYLYDAIRLIAFELGLRFFTDYLAGNVYFKVNHPTHNLSRALVQFKLTESIEAQAETLKDIILALQ
ncbi:MAG: aminoglycoside phosphotransferase family protein [Cyanobacteria bacterium P01_F01_bin.53]